LFWTLINYTRSSFLNLVKWLLNLFNNKGSVKKTEPAQPKIEQPKTEPIKESDIKKIALLVGHGAGDSGAVCRRNRLEEHTYNSIAAETIAQSDVGKSIKVFYKSNSGWLGTYAKVKLFNPDLTIEMHLNDADSLAVGCEVLCVNKDSKSCEVGKQFASEFCKEFQRRIRGDKGIKWMQQGGRGYMNLVGAKAVSPRSILIEPFFINTESEWIEPSRYAEFLIKFLRGL